MERSLATIRAVERLSFLHGIEPIAVAARCSHRRGCVFFDTARASAADDGALSLIAAEPVKILRGNSAKEWETLQAEIALRRCEPAHGEASPPYAPAGFAAGWIEYDGAFCFGLYENLFIYRQATGEWFGVGDLETLRRWWEEGAQGGAAVRRKPLEFRAEGSREAYIRAVERAQEYIAAGDIYQVNVTHRFSAPWEGAPFSFYEALRTASPAPHAAYLGLGEGRERAVLSSSPELFLKISGRTVTTRPIKGTRPRGSDAASDARQAEELISSSKEASELVMITDLERNDLGQICEFGSVSVPDLLRLEAHEQVFHLVSTVRGRLREGIDAVAAVRACFPGGSITGAPKKRAREIIAELESVPRGLYTGAIGYFGFNGESQFNIAIRTVIIEDGCSHFHVGAGIVADSLPEQEWQETLDKAAGILLAARRWSE